MKKFLCLLSFSMLAVMLYSCTAAPGTTNNPGGSGGNPVVLDLGVYVATNGNDTNVGTNASAPLLTLQIAVSNAVANGLTNIYVAEGVYAPGTGLNAAGSGVLITNDNIHLIGGYSSDFSVRTNKSELDANKTLAHVITVTNSQNVLIDGFIVENGNAASGNGGGLDLIQLKNSVISNTVISNNFGNLFGGGIHIFDSTGNTISAEIVSNIGYSGGGIFIDNYCLSNTIDSVIVKNKARSGYGGGIYMGDVSFHTVTGLIASNLSANEGGGIAVNGGSNNTINADILWNSSIYNAGGGIYIGTSSKSIVIRGNVVSNVVTNDSGGGILCLGDSCIIQADVSWNSCPVAGGGIYINNGSGNVVSNSRIANNYAFRGGGLEIASSSSYNEIVDSVISNNTGCSYGGGISIIGNDNTNMSLVISNRVTNETVTSRGGGIYIVGSRSYIGGTIACNLTPMGTLYMGGGIAVYGYDTVISAVIRDNFAPFGGGINIESVTGTIITNCTITGNTATNGGGIRFNASSGTVVNCMIRNNICDSAGNGYGGGIYIYVNSNPQILNNSIISNYAGAAGGGMMVDNASPLIKNNVISTNSGGSWGDNLCFNTSSSTNIGNTLLAPLNNSLGIASCYADFLIVSNLIGGSGPSSSAIRKYLDCSNYTMQYNTFPTNTVYYLFVDAANSLYITNLSGVNNPAFTLAEPGSTNNVATNL